MSVDLVIQHAMRMCHIVIYCLSGSTGFLNIFSQAAGFSKIVMEHKMCIWIFSLNFV